MRRVLLVLLVALALVGCSKLMSRPLTDATGRTAEQTARAWTAHHFGVDVQHTTVLQHTRQDRTHRRILVQAEGVGPDHRLETAIVTVTYNQTDGWTVAPPAETTP